MAVFWCINASCCQLVALLLRSFEGQGVAVCEHSNCLFDCIGHLKWKWATLLNCWFQKTFHSTIHLEIQCLELFYCTAFIEFHTHHTPGTYYLFHLERRFQKWFFLPRDIRPMSRIGRFSSTLRRQSRRRDTLVTCYIPAQHTLTHLPKQLEPKPQAATVYGEALLMRTSFLSNFPWRSSMSCCSLDHTYSA